MASSTTVFDSPAKLLYGFGTTQQKALQKFIAYVCANLPAVFAGTVATFTGLVTAGTIVAKDVVTPGTTNGALTIAAGTVEVTKAGVLAMTLAAPTAGQAGTIMRIVSNSANAHTLTATGLIDDGITGGSKNLATFAAFPGASITLVALGLKWKVLSNNNVVVS